MSIKKITFYLSFFMLLSCDGEDSKPKEENPALSSVTGINFYNKDFKVNSNLDSSKYLIKLDNAAQNSPNLLVGNLSSDSQSGFVYALNSSDQVVSLFNPFNSGELKNISKKGNTSIMVGEFTKDELICLVVVSGDSSSTCLVTKQNSINSVGATFINSENQIALLVDNTNTGKKELYLYNSNDGFIGVSSNSTSLVEPLEFNLSGAITDAYSSNDYAAFYIKGGNGGELLFLKNNGDTETKINSVTSGSVQSINGEPIFMSDGNLRQGWGNSLYYNENSNNRTVSSEAVLVSSKDAFFQIYYQEDYNDRGYNNPMIFYLKPRRSDLPVTYPDYTLDSINCCLYRKVDGNLSGDVQRMDWKYASGYKKYAIAYGEVATSNSPEYSALKKNVDKAIILINADEKDEDDDGNFIMKRKILFDEGNTNSNEDNLIVPLSFDSVTNITNYVNGFKIEGVLHSNNKTLYYNPESNSIETPSTNDQQSFTIQKRL